MQYCWKCLLTKVLVLFSQQIRCKLSLALVGLGILIFISPTLSFAANFAHLSNSEQLRIADLIFKNECNRKVECLVSWNDGEDFVSLGIGHFIWFPKNSTAPFQESFPDLLRWFEAHNVEIPQILQTWLKPNKPCPWQTKQDFLSLKNKNNIQALRTFLTETKAEQSTFIMFRLKQALPKMLASVESVSDKAHITQQFERVAASPSGWYALVDYVNFKGEGIKASERYQGEGWGLTQVLLQMKGEAVGVEAMQSFIDAARFILERRVQLSPAKRHEQRWLEGWLKRINTYKL